MKLSNIQFLPLAKGLLRYIQIGVDHLVLLRASGQEVDADTLSIFLQMKMKNWNPIFKGRIILDVPTKAAAARFLAGVVLRLVQSSEFSQESSHV